MSYFWPLGILRSVYETIALGIAVPPRRHLKLENVLLQSIALECGVVRLIQRAFCNDPSHIYYFLGNLCTIMTSHVGVVPPTNEAVPKLSLLKI